MHLTLLYHKIVNIELLKKQLILLKKHYAIIHSHEPRGGKTLSLTFDDATADFYFRVYPLLQELDIKAILGLPTKMALENTEDSPEQRMAKLPTFEGPTSAFCTWKELQELAKSPLIEIASHSHSHSNLLHPQAQIDRELSFSKELIEKRLGLSPHAFIFPYGKWSKGVLKKTLLYYRVAYRIGSAANFFHKPLQFRIPQDREKDFLGVTRPLNNPKYLLKYLLKNFY